VGRRHPRSRADYLRSPLLLRRISAPALLLDCADHFVRVMRVGAAAHGRDPRRNLVERRPRPQLQIWLCVLTLTLVQLGIYTRSCAAKTECCVRILPVRTARAKGASEPRVRAHAPNRSHRCWTSWRCRRRTILGALITETMFAWPAWARRFYQAF